MNRRYKLSPSILAAKLLELPETFKILNKIGVDSIHIDVMDGQFVNNLTIGPAIIKEIRPLSSLPFYGHLMILTPEKLLDDFLKAGIDMVIFHIEATSHPIDIITTVKKHGKKVGIALNPITPAERIYDFINFIDSVLIMTVNPGFYGQGIIFEPLNKIKYIREKNADIEIIVDGGIKLANLKQVLQYNPTTIVSSSEIFLNSNIEKTIKEFFFILR